MNRRYFLFFSVCAIPYITPLLAFDSSVYRSKIWSASSINDAAMALYGKEKFSTIQKSEEVELIVPKGSISDRDNIIIGVSSRIKSKTVAIFQDANPQSLVAVFHVNEGSIIEYELTIRMEFKGTIFAVVEDLNGNLYYTRAYVDVLTMSCMAS